MAHHERLLICVVRIHIPSLDEPDLVRELIEDAWRSRAPKRVVAAYDAERT
jgi:hypothetical protein